MRGPVGGKKADGSLQLIVPASWVVEFQLYVWLDLVVKPQVAVWEKEVWCVGSVVDMRQDDVVVGLLQLEESLVVVFGGLSLSIAICSVMAQHTMASL